MTLSILNKYFPCQTEVYKNRLMNLFEQLERCDNLFYALILQEAGKYKLAYTSPSAAWLTEYSMENFSYEDGFSFIYSITPRSFRKEILDQETYIFIKAREAELDLSKPFFGYINGGLERMDGRILT